MSDPIRPLRVVTLPPGLTDPVSREWAFTAASTGAELLELRTDLHPADLSLRPLVESLPLLVSERGQPLPPAWIENARRIDVPLGAPLPAEAERVLVSEHFAAPMSMEAALAAWDGLAEGASLKHVEPLGEPARVEALLDLQERLIRRFGAGRVTVLAMGPWALPARALLARRNALDYLALGSGWSSAAGQRLLSDAVRAGAAQDPTSRLGIVGTSIAHSRSPRLHPQPFDRIDLPADAPVEALVDTLIAHYRGLAVTSPFKKRLAAHVGAPRDAINTLWRESGRWRGENTDLEGAREALRRLGPGEVHVLGDGGVAGALREVGAARVRVHTRAQLKDASLKGLVLWTWPVDLPPPEGLRFEPGTRVGVIAYGPPGRALQAQITRLGGTPVALGMPWLLAQARRQRALFLAAD